MFAVPSALCTASINASVDIIRLLLERGACANFRDACRNTPLHFAVMFRENYEDPDRLRRLKEIIRALLAAAADVNKKNGKLPEEQMTPLGVACSAGSELSLPIVELLLCNGADANRFTGCALFFAVCEGNPVLTELLIAFGADVSVRFPHQLTVLHVAVGRFPVELSRKEEDKKKRKQEKQFVDLFDPFDSYPKETLSSSEETNGKTDAKLVTNRYIATMKLLLLHGAEVGAVGDLGSTPLCLAVEKNLVRVAARLLAKGADANGAMPDGKSLLCVACAAGSIKMAKLLLKYGASANAEQSNRPPSNGTGKTTAYHTIPLIIAVQKASNFKLVKLLLDCGADVNVLDGHGGTPLDYALNAAEDGEIAAADRPRRHDCRRPTADLRQSGAVVYQLLNLVVLRGVRA